MRKRRNNEEEDNTEVLANFIEDNRIYLYGDIDNKTALELHVILSTSDECPAERRRIGYQHSLPGIMTSPETTNDPLYLYINSTGGSVDAAISIMASLRSTKRQVITDVCSVGGSAAAWLALFGHKRRMSSFASMMFHSPIFMPLEETLEDRENNTLYSRRHYESLMKQLLSTTKMSFKEFKLKTDNQDWYLLAKDAKKLGFIHEIY